MLAHCREGFVHTRRVHLGNLRPILHERATVTRLLRIEVHGPLNSWMRAEAHWPPYSHNILYSKWLAVTHSCGGGMLMLLFRTPIQTQRAPWCAGHFYRRGLRAKPMPLAGSVKACRLPPL